MVVLRALIVGAAIAAPALAIAHVAVQPVVATAGGYQVLRFGVGHGCDGKATTALRILLPAGLESARPQPKPGWKLDIVRAAGSPDAVTAIRWRGHLPADQYDEFLISVKLPAAAGPLAFPAEQTCGAVVTGWVEAVVPGGPRPARPAPVVTLSAPAGAEAAHHH